MFSCCLWELSTELIVHGLLYLKTNFCYLLRVIETFRITSQPSRPTVVVEGVNSTGVSLAWSFSLTINESIRVIHFYRQRSGGRDTRIATKRGNRPFAYASDEFKANYEAQSSSNSATLLLLDVNNNEEYTYTVRVSYYDGNSYYYPRYRTDVVVYGKCNCPNHFSPLNKAVSTWSGFISNKRLCL